MPMFWSKIFQFQPLGVRVVKQLLGTLDSLESIDDTNRSNYQRMRNASHAVGVNLQSLKTVLLSTDVVGTYPAHHRKERKLQTLTLAITNQDALYEIVKSLHKLELDAQQSVVKIFINLLRRYPNPDSPIIRYILSRQEILLILLAGYGRREIALRCGEILRECTRYEALTVAFLRIGRLQWLFDHIQAFDAAFDTTFDAFLTMQKILINHPRKSLSFLRANYDDFFGQMIVFLQSANCLIIHETLVTLLCIFGSSCHTVDIVMRFLSSVSNMKLMIDLMRHRLEKVRINAFNIFKMFVFLAEIPWRVLKFLVASRNSLIDFIARFHTHSDDEAFQYDRRMVINKLKRLTYTEENEETRWRDFNNNNADDYYDDGIQYVLEL